jgi:hypothetical protein
VIHYHGTPVGGKREEVARFLAGRHALVSYAYPEDIGAALECCKSVVLDNGAFTAWKQGGKLNVDGYLCWVESLWQHPAFTWALIPDVIDGTETDNDAMLTNWPIRIPGVPVYHMHESLERAERLAEYWPIVAIGSSGQWPNPGTDSWWRRMAEIMGVMCDSEGRPKCKIHGLRMLNPAIFHRLPLASADSTNAVQNGVENRFGMYPPPTSGQRSMVIANRIESHNSAAIWRPLEKQTTLCELPLWNTAELTAGTSDG